MRSSNSVLPLPAPGETAGDQQTQLLCCSVQHSLAHTHTHTVSPTFFRLKSRLHFTFGRFGLFNFQAANC